MEFIVGMWMFTGMSLRMAQELGLHRQRSLIYSKIGRSPANDVTANEENVLPMESPPTREKTETFEKSSQIILFWCVLVQDTYLSNGTGRVPSIKRSHVNIRLPTDLDLAIVRAGPGKDPGTVKRFAFPGMVRMVLEYAESIEFLNTEPQKDTLSESEMCERFHQLKSIRQGIMRNYGSIPQELRLGANNYQAAVRSSEAGPYLLLHFQFELQIAFLTQARLAVSDELSKELCSPNPTYKPMETEQSVLSDRKADYDIYREAIKSIVDLLTIVKMIDSRALWSTFWLNQALFHAACAYIRDMLQFQHKLHESYSSSEQPWPLPSQTSPSVVFNHEDYREQSPRRSEPTAAEEYLALIAKTNYHFLRQAVKYMAKYYAGANWVDAVLDQRETGLRDVDLSIVSDSISTFVRLHDLRARDKGRAKSNEVFRPFVCSIALH